MLILLYFNTSFSGGGAHDLGQLMPGGEYWANAINNSGQIVGSVFDTRGYHDAFFSDGPGQVGVTELYGTIPPCIIC